jgi:hypothetical protein
MTAIHPTAADREPVLGVAALVGVIFLVGGLLGFVPGVTSDYDEMELAGHESGAQLMGLFQVSILHNAVHLLFGVVGVLMARAVATARIFLIGAGVIYLALWVYGLVIDRTSDANFVPVNAADNWLHLALGAVMLALGLVFLTRNREVPG